MIMLITAKSYHSSEEIFPRYFIQGTISHHIPSNTAQTWTQTQNQKPNSTLQNHTKSTNLYSNLNHPLLKKRSPFRLRHRKLTPKITERPLRYHQKPIFFFFLFFCFLNKKPNFFGKLLLQGNRCEHLPNTKAFLGLNRRTRLTVNKKKKKVQGTFVEVITKRTRKSWKSSKDLLL